MQDKMDDRQGPECVSGLQMIKNKQSERSVKLKLQLLSIHYNVTCTYTEYIKKRNTYIFLDNLRNFKDVHFKLAGYID